MATDNHRVPGAGENAEVMAMGYGGLVVGYIIPVSALFDAYVDVLGGAGGLTTRSSAGKDQDPVFVFEPTISLDLRLASFKRLGMGVGVGAGYRFVGDVDTPGVRERDLRGVTGLIRVRAGWF